MTANFESFASKRKLRRNFRSIEEIAPMPNLIKIQRQSYQSFLQMNVDHAKRIDVGLQEVFKSVFPINDFSERASLEFDHYILEQPKYSVEECQQRGLTFSSALSWKSYCVSDA